MNLLRTLGEADILASGSSELLEPCKERAGPVALSETSVLSKQLSPPSLLLLLLRARGDSLTLLIDGWRVPRQFKREGLHHAGDMPHVDGAAAPVPTRPISFQYPGEFSSVLTNKVCQ